MVWCFSPFLYPYFHTFNIFFLSLFLTLKQQSFAADLLDMADNLHRTAAIVPESFRKDVLANDTSSNAKLLVSMLEGVNMTEKQMLKVFLC